MLGWIIFIGLLLFGLALFSMVFWLWMLIDCVINPDLRPQEKLVWVLLIIFANIIGAILYLFLGREPGDRTTKRSISQLSRSRSDKMIAGVCGGLGHYFKIDPAIVRIAWVVFTLLGASGILLYIVCWIIIPLETAHSTKKRVNTHLRSVRKDASSKPVPKSQKKQSTKKSKKASAKSASKKKAKKRK